MKISISLLFMLFLFSCHSLTALEKYGQHYQRNKDYNSLSKVIELMQLQIDTSAVRNLLGEPIDMGFDFRYLVDSTGPNGCVIGAVFHIDEQGKIDQKWIDEICE